MRKRRTTKEEDALIEQIADRASKISKADRMTVQMDLTACIEGGCSLRLQDMLDANNANLLHDLAGINKNINHVTYKLENNFWPRFAE